MVRKLGTLARLALRDDEVERFGKQTGRIIGYFQSLKALNLVGVGLTSASGSLAEILLRPLKAHDLSGVEPTAHVIDIECWRRPDEPGETLKCLPDLFPYLKYGYFQVPRILPEDDSDSTTKAPGFEEESSPEFHHQDTNVKRV